MDERNVPAEADQQDKQTGVNGGKQHMHLAVIHQVGHRRHLAFQRDRCIGTSTTETE